MIQLKIKKKSFFIVLILVFMLLGNCVRNDYYPKPKAYPSVVLPKKKYVLYNAECPYSFEYPVYGVIEDKKYFFNERLKSDSCWINIALPSLNGKIHLSYKSFNNTDSLTKMMEDAYKMTSKHTLKADYIKDSLIDEPNLKGIIYDVGGNAASSVQFFLTDDKKNYVRGALYFAVAPNIDSMQPVVQFAKADVLHLIKTFTWK